MLKGTYTLLITPFKDDLSLDEEGLRILVKRQVDAGVHGIAPLGVTGENSLLTEEEIQRVMEIIVEEVNGKCKVIPDTCTSSVDMTLKRINLYRAVGCDYVAVYVPFLVLPKEDGVISFYEKVADESKVPILIHNSPGRVVVNLTPGTIAKLARHPNIIGIKDGYKMMDHLAKVLYLTKDEDFSLFTGKDTTLLPLLSFGGQGNFSVAGNIIPEVMENIFTCYSNSEYEKARELHYSFYDLFEAIRSETNPIPAKEALHLMGLPGGKVRPPLTELSQPKREKLKNILRDRSLI